MWVRVPPSGPIVMKEVEGLNPFWGAMQINIEVAYPGARVSFLVDVHEASWKSLDDKDKHHYIAAIVRDNIDLWLEFKWSDSESHDNVFSLMND